MNSSTKSAEEDKPKQGSWQIEQEYTVGTVKKGNKKYEYFSILTIFTQEKK